MAEEKDPKKLDFDVDSQAFENLEKEVKEVCYLASLHLFLAPPAPLLRA